MVKNRDLNCCVRNKYFKFSYVSQNEVLDMDWIVLFGILISAVGLALSGFFYFMSSKNLKLVSESLEGHMKTNTDKVSEKVKLQIKEIDKKISNVVVDPSGTDLGKNIMTASPPCDFNNEDALEIFKNTYKRARQGDPESQLKIGQSYMIGENIPKDYREAMNWFKKSADLGNAEAMKNIGSIYYGGGSDFEDYERAMNWFKKSANLGNAEAMSCVGSMYYLGD